MDVQASYTKYSDEREWAAHWGKVPWTYFGFMLNLRGEISICAFGRQLEFGRLRKRTVIPVQKTSFNLNVKEA